MVGDVRFKIRLRLKAVIEQQEKEYWRDEAIRKEIFAAQLDPVTAEKIRARYRSEIVREFPGCEITITRLRITIKLPSRYPAHNVPISEVYPSVLVGAYFPPVAPVF